MLNALHYHRNRPYLRAFLCVLLVSWFSLVFSAICIMPNAWSSHTENVMPAGCHESDMLTSQDTTTSYDCSLKPCFDSQNNQSLNFQLDKLDFPLFLFYFYCFFLVFCFSFYKPKLSQIHITAPPIGRRLLLIYRYCTLLN